jgi:hypothetical protein
VGKNIVICLDGTNNQLRAADNTNVVRLLDALKLDEPDKQVAYYDPGVGTFSSPAAWTPPARLVSRYAGLAFGAGLRENLGQAYSFITSTYQPGDEIYVFGFSRGAYNARALVGMLDVFGIFRNGSDNLVPYAVSAYTKQQRRDDPEFFPGLNVYAKTHAIGRTGHTPVRFLGLWDTVKSAGTLARQLRWPFTRQFPHVHVVRHAVAIDEIRRPYPPYLVHSPDNSNHIRARKGAGPERSVVLGRALRRGRRVLEGHEALRHPAEVDGRRSRRGGPADPPKGIRADHPAGPIRRSHRALARDVQGVATTRPWPPDRPRRSAHPRERAGAGREASRIREEAARGIPIRGRQLA